MEETKKTTEQTEQVEQKNETKANEKLSYEDLERMAVQISQKCDHLVNENKALKERLVALSTSTFYTELDFKFKVLDHSVEFDPEFVERIVNDIQDLMTPSNDQPTEQMEN